MAASEVHDRYNLPRHVHTMTLDTTNARQRLLDAALEVFAAKGYASSSTREICRMAGANVSAIHYYFGDKASLYRQLFERLDQFLELPPELTAIDTRLDRALFALYRHLLGFTVTPARSQMLRTLFVREQLQPTGMLSESQMQGLTPFYTTLLGFLKRHLAVDEPDTDLHRLAFSLLGLASMLMVDQETIDTFAPDILADKERTARQLAQQALVLIKHESDRRSGCREISP